jgi:hypothetical protein
MEAPIIGERTRKRTRKVNGRRSTSQVDKESSTSTQVRERFLAIAVPHDDVALSNNGHGRQKFQELIDVLLQSEVIPATLCFYTEGVRWLTRESPVLSQLQEIRRRGAEILACRACLTEAGLLDAFAVGRLDTQDNIDDILRHAQHTMVV